MFKKETPGFACFTLLVCFVAPALTCAMSLDDAVSQYRKGVVFIRVEKQNPTNGAITEETGTGFIVNKEGYVVTADHVVLGGAGIQTNVRGASGSREGVLESMEVLSESSNFDVALLKFKDTSMDRKPIPLGDPWLVSGSATVYTMGFPGKEEWFSTSGTISGKSGSKGSWDTTLTLNPGMSGAPVFNTDGKIIAMVWGSVAVGGVSGINRILPINLLADVLRFANAAATYNEAVSANSLNLTRIIDVTYRFDGTQDIHDNLQPTLNEYQKQFHAQEGYKIIDYNFVGNSVNHATIKSTRLSPDGKTLYATFSLESGPAYDRWRGWIDGSFITRQQKE